MAALSGRSRAISIRRAGLAAAGRRRLGGGRVLSAKADSLVESSAIAAQPGRSHAAAAPRARMLYALAACRQYQAAHLAKADSVVVALAPAAHHDFVAVFEEGTGRAAFERERSLSIPGELEQASPRIRRRSADRARCHEIAVSLIAAGDGVMSALLRHAPVEMALFGPAKRGRC